ncbi:MAG: precorrin-2/cobalt-factor-2 C20-methyltransferase [Frankiaceae bacterium]|nr:precorrin-2/cobalt-factor-2 C20-methyltransferase [Frankiaceae bacterium]
MTAMPPRLIGVGVGPGDPELVTVKGVNALTNADHVFVPVADTGEVGRAEATVLAHVDAARVSRLAFALTDDAARNGGAWDAAAASVVAAIGSGGTAAFATIGDPNIYSTFSYLAQTVRALLPDVVVDTIPGITAMQDLAARSGTVLVEGREHLILLPFTAGDAALDAALDDRDATIVFYKGGRAMGAVLDSVRGADRIEGAVYGAKLGLDGEEIGLAAEHDAAPAPYLTTLIIPARRHARGGKL